MLIPGDEQASFTKDQMQQGKHTEYEKALHEEMLNSLSHQDEVGMSELMVSRSVIGLVSFILYPVSFIILLLVGERIKSRFPTQ